ncbi:MAG TPA: phosphatase PAP2 family protein [Dictyobacter sp.]|nr:phosphatase PAP2 family protein [Dictyobacter sp.]
MRQKHIDDRLQENMHGVVEKAQQEVARSQQPWYLVFRQAQLLIALYFIGFVFFGILAWFVHVHPVLAIDVHITREFQENQMPGLRMFMLAVSWLGYQPVVFSGFILLAAILFWLVRLRLEACCIVALSVVSEIINVSLKYIVSRPRPSTNLVDVWSRATGPSFPSGHVMSYVAFWGLLLSFGIILLKRDRWWHYLFLIVPAFFVMAVGPSRIYLGDHWASDVLGAYLLSGLLLGLTLWLYLVLKQRGVLVSQRKQ